MDHALFHIISHDEWNLALDRGRHEPESLSTQGFVHLSARSQILRPANLLYRGRSDLRLLVIDPSGFGDALVWEPGSHGEAEDFPHLYAALDVDVVRETIPFPCEGDGSFTLPEQLRGPD